MWLEIIALLVTALFLWDHLKMRRQNKMLAAAGVKGPLQLPLLGNAPLFMLGENAESR